MPRTTWLPLALLAALGCTRPAPPTPPSADDRPAAVTSATPATSTTPSPAPTSPASATQPPQAAGPPLRELAARYLDSDGQGGWRTNEQAATDLEKLTPGQLAQFWLLLADSQVEVRRGASVFLLTQLDPDNSDHVSTFTARLVDADSMVRARALDAVRQFNRPDKVAALPRLSAMLDPAREDRAENRTSAARLCHSLKGVAASALPALEKTAANDPDPRTRAAALAAIAQIGQTDQVVKLLAAALADSDAAVRIVAAARLRQLGPAAKPAASQLAATLADSNTDVSEAAAEALIRMGPSAVALLAGQLSSSSTSAKKLALACLAKIGPPAKTVAATIEKCKQDPDPQVRQLAEAALNRISGK